jgi:hypothetical protein
MNDEDTVKDIEELEEIEKELKWKDRGRKIVCTCDSDPDFCEIHNEFVY